MAERLCHSPRNGCGRNISVRVKRAATFSHHRYQQGSASPLLRFRNSRESLRILAPTTIAPTLQGERHGKTGEK